MCFHSISFAVQNIPSSWVEFKCEQDCHYCDKSSIFTVFYGCLSLSFCSSHALFLFPFTPPRHHPPSLSLSLLLPQSRSSCRCQMGMTTICSPPAPWHLEMGWETATAAHRHVPVRTHTVLMLVKMFLQKGNETRNGVWGGAEVKKERAEWCSEIWLTSNGINISCCHYSEQILFLSGRQ